MWNKIKVFFSWLDEVIAYEGYTYEELCQAAGGGGKGGGGSSQRPVTQQELVLWDSQAKNLDMLTKIAEEQYNIGEEDRSYYEKVFREGSDTEAKEAIAKLKSKITGETVDPSSIESTNIDSLLRDTILASTPEFQKLATEVVETSNTLTKQYGADVSGLSQTFSKGIEDLTSNYQKDLQSIKEQTGTIRQDVLSRETGASLAGISQAYQEAQKQLQSTMAKRGLTGSGVEMRGIGDLYNQEALAKAGAGTQARMSALQQSETIRQQQIGISGAQLQAGVSGLQTGYQAQMGALGNVYGVTSANLQQGLQTTNAATLQGIAGLTQVAQAGQGLYAGSQNYLAQAAQSSGQAAQIAGSSAAQVGQLDSNWAIEQQKMKAEKSGTLLGGLMSAGSSLGSAAILASDKRLKTKITKIDEINGHNIYTWDWIEGHDYGYNKGVLAQEVLEKQPDAVIVMDNGYYAVDYSKLGVL